MFYTQQDRDRDASSYAMLVEMAATLRDIATGLAAVRSGLLDDRASATDPTEYDPPPRVDEADELQAQRVAERG